MQRTKAGFWKQAILLRLLTAFIAGMTICSLTGVLMHSFVFLLLAATFLIIPVFAVRKQKPVNKWVEAIFLYSGFFIAGYYSMSETVEIPNLRLLQKSDQPCVCTVHNTKRTQNGTFRMEVAIYIPDIQSHQACEGLLYTKDTLAAAVSEGDTLLAPMQWERIRNNGIPFSFDYKKHCARRGIFVRSFCRDGAIIIAGKYSAAKKPFLLRLHAHMDRILNESIKEQRTRALLKAMLLGDEEEIDPETRTVYSDTGIIHIVSISGAHVALLFTIINILLYWLSGRSRKWFVFVTSMLAIILYVAMAGAPSSAVRAALMFLLVQIGILSEKQANPFNQLAAPALLMLLFRPEWLFNIGFQLSFLAVFSLLLFYKPLLSLWPTPRPLLRWFRNAIAASIAAEILVAPLVAYYFHSFPLMFLPANLIAAVGMTLLELLGILLLLLAGIPPLQTLLAGLLTTISQEFHYLIFKLQEISISGFKSLWLNTTTVILIYILIATTASYIKYRSKTAARVSAGMILLLTTIHLYHTCITERKDILVLWNNHRAASGVLLRGGNAFVLPQYSMSAKDISQLMIRQNVSDSRLDAPAAFLINRYRIAAPDSLTVPGEMFPVDVLLVNKYPRSVKATDFLKCFSPSIVVISNRLPGKLLAEWKQECRRYKAHLHYIPEEGAFVFPTPSQR